jgi:hypothetical protein
LFLEQAAAKDPNFVLAYVGSADAFDNGNIIGVLCDRLNWQTIDGDKGQPP